MLPRLSEATRRAGTRPPIGIVHIGAGAFHRAHQATFTADAGGWGICAVAPRHPDTVEQLAPQDGLFSVLVRHPDEDRLEVVTCLREALHAPTQEDAVLARIADPATHVVSLTITERGYRRPAPAIDLLVRGLREREAPLTVLSCDNLPRNGSCSSASCASASTCATSASSARSSTGSCRRRPLPTAPPPPSCSASMTGRSSSPSRSANG
jgi:fructuronate reductase